MYSHIIFDLDGTLIESLPGIAQALNNALSAHKLPTHSLDAVRGFIGDGSLVLCQRATKDQPESLQLAVHDTFLLEYPKAWKAGTSVFEGVLPLIAKLKSMQCTLSILSNKPHHFTTEIVDHFFPDSPFDLVLGQREGIAKKPDPSGVHELLGELDQSSANSILIGDSTIDIITARNAGIKSLAVTWGYHNKEALLAVAPSHAADTLDEVIEILTPTHTPAFRQPAELL
ncbi:HAD family hydrolase [Rubritalea tangerina]|uniref:phosphoglycolate phosphatase n=2 Tax=Rubritalea tangerina TaxID=430798 RepID=A0ABW4ZEE0_9BACT